MQLNIILFILLIFLDTIFDLCSKKTSVCVEKENRAFAIIVFHHIFCIFLYFGWLLDNKYVLLIYLASIFATVSLWIILGPCKITEKTNEICDWDDHEKFNDIMNYFNDKMQPSPIKIHLPVMLIGAFIGIWKLIGKF